MTQLANYMTMIYSLYEAGKYFHCLYYELSYNYYYF